MDMNKTKILIAVDMQNDFIDGSLGTQEAVKIVEPAVRAIKEFDGEVLYTMDTHFENYMDTMEGKKLPVLHCIKGTVGWQVEPRVMAALEKRSARCFEKRTFGSYELAEYVASVAADDASTELTLLGLCTDICVASNAILLRAKLPNAVIRVLSGCCAGVTPQSHEAALTTMRMCQIDVMGD